MLRRHSLTRPALAGAGKFFRIHCMRIIHAAHPWEKRTKLFHDVTPTRFEKDSSPGTRKTAIQRGTGSTPY